MLSRQVGLVDGGGSGPWCVRCAAARSHRIGDDGDRGGARRLHAVNARRTKIKALYGHRNGFCLWYKRLEGFDLWRGGPHETLHFESVTYNRSQTVTMPLEFRFPESVREVFIRREGESVVLTPRPTDWSGFFASGLTASADFMADAERLPIQERSF